MRLLAFKSISLSKGGSRILGVRRHIITWLKASYSPF